MTYQPRSEFYSPIIQGECIGCREAGIQNSASGVGRLEFRILHRVYSYFSEKYILKKFIWTNLKTVQAEMAMVSNTTYIISSDLNRVQTSKTNLDFIIIGT
uniref:Uncharacterized protein n=1 Tax=Nelumbo nucifera TaxID=4432 RepID=A0A822YWA4_NELNU|nr:TPA_asm: hypothetical protein HUJ06_007084 [Nelumbo nucifera]